MARRLGDVLDLMLGEPAREPWAAGAVAVPLDPTEVLRARALVLIARAIAVQGVACRVVGERAPGPPADVEAAPDSLVLRIRRRGAPWPELRAVLFVSPDAGERQSAREAIESAPIGGTCALVVDGVRSLAEARAVAWSIGAGRPSIRLLGALREERRLAGALLLGGPTAVARDLRSVADGLGGLGVGGR